MADGVRPPEPDAAGGAGLADVRDTSAPASAPPEPGVGLAAPPGQGRTETRGPSAAPPPQGRRSADADERQGPARLCLGAAPLAGLRQAPARRRRPPADWASEGAPLLAPREAAGADVTRGWDQRPTPPHGAFYAAFAAARVRASLTRLHCGAPPPHGRGLPGADGARRCCTRQGRRDRRSGALPALQSAIAAWSNKR